MSKEQHRALGSHSSDTHQAWAMMDGAHTQQAPGSTVGSQAQGCSSHPWQTSPKKLMATLTTFPTLIKFV